MFVDLSSAFDHINRDWLFQTIKNRLAEESRNNKIINILQSLYKQTNTEIPFKSISTFQATSDVRQGGIESPLLFSLFLDYVMRVFLKTVLKKR